jgi:DNA-directed RNA polymerase specialized sigma24 family protein
MTRHSEETLAASPGLRPTPATGAGESHEAELALVRAILEGSEAAWREFVERYSGLILAVIRRYVRDVDELRTVYVDVLAALYRRKFRQYEGRAAISTWLTLVTRSEVLDHLRRRVGRHSTPEGLRRLDADHRLIFRLYYIEGRTLSDVLAALPADPRPWTLTMLLRALQQIEERLDSRWLRRIAYDLHAQSVGAASGRMLEYLDHVRSEFQENSGAHSPEFHLMEREARRTADQLAAQIERLDPAERELLTLRFERGWTARRIADELGFADTRGVYTILERIVRRLRRILIREREGDA